MFKAEFKEHKEDVKDKRWKISKISAYQLRDVNYDLPRLVAH